MLVFVVAFVAAVLLGGGFAVAVCRGVRNREN
jgi:hypothetical protein